MSKLRYGLQLTHKVRMTEEDTKTKDIKAVQIAQNKLLRLLDGSRVKDRRSIKDMLDKFDLLSINQTLAQIKLTEAWKASKDVDYPIEMKPKKEPLGDTSTRQLRTTTRKEMREGGKTILAEKSFTRDAGKLWNVA